jgi:hypothetical protein
MSRVELDPERGRVVAVRLKELGAKGVLITAAEQGYITQLACKKRDGGHGLVDNTILAHRLCNRIDYSISVRGRPNPRDLERVRKAREEAIRRRRS